MAAEQPVLLLVELERDLGAPADGWAAELGRRGVVVVADDLGRLAITRSSARAIYAEAREAEARAARLREEIEQRAIAADEARRAALPVGIPAGMVPEGMSAGQLMMMSDPMPRGARRESMVEHALRGGGVTFHPIGGEGAS
jgi:hypothetical protein